MKGFIYGVVMMINLLAIAAGWFVLKTIDKGQHIQFIKSGCGIESLLEANERVMR